MGIFRSRSTGPGMGWSMYAPGQEAFAPEWQSSVLRSLAPRVGFAVLRQRDGEISRLKNREFSRPGDSFRQVDLRRRLIQIHPQSIPTADAMQVTITMALTASTIDPVKFVSDSQNPDEEIYLAAQIALREMVVAMPLEDFIGVRIDVESVLAAAQAAAKNVGVEVSSILLKDLNLPVSTQAHCRNRSWRRSKLKLIWNVHEMK
ncbi:hypothetical protein N24_3164 [Corynebacterium suranareeae]|uniref:Band 7 domain-containing protein n=1 Tax=Corynebacterium suranareeae TaxID=2506452 RepID=A0A169SCP5_9CORY|nr:hypothetical protein N24_3164 [Corynebacterium suranareeae]